MTLQNAKRDWDTWESEFDYKVMVLSSENYGPMALLWHPPSTKTLNLCVACLRKQKARKQAEDWSKKKQGHPRVNILAKCAPGDGKNRHGST